MTGTATLARDMVARQLWATFVAPGSHFSLPALLVSVLTLAIALAVVRGRAVSFRLLRRVILPRRLWLTASGRLDLGFALLGITLTGAMIGWALVTAEVVRHAVAPWLGTPTAPWMPAWLAGIVATLILFLAYEFAYWLDHWLMHRIPALWHFHKVHHQAEGLSLLSNFRVHPLETIGFFNLAALILGLTRALTDRLLGSAASPWEAGASNLIVVAAAALVTNLQHSHLWWRFGEAGSRWLLGPAHHQVHHSREERHYNRNFGNVLTLFDRAFGTFWLPAERREVARFGVEDGPDRIAADPHTWRAALIDPFVHAAHDIARPLRRAIALLLGLALVSCGGSPRIVQQPARPIVQPSDRDTAACHVDLNRMGVRFSILPDRATGPGCGISGAVQLVDIGVPVTNLTAVRCGEARAFTGWVRSALAPAAYQLLGSELARVETMGSYSCRNVIGTSGAARRSGHAIANAIDVAGVTLKDGRRVTIARDWRSPDLATQRFLQAIHASACKRFGTVLSPDYNAEHHDHLHLEDDRASFCR